jgi:hypothetical protein
MVHCGLDLDKVKCAGRLWTEVWEPWSKVEKRASVVTILMLMWLEWIEG